MHQQRFTVLVLMFFLALMEVSSHAKDYNNWNWVRPIKQTFRVTNVTFGQKQFVAVGEHGTVLTSSDGITWSIVKLGVEKEISGIAYGNGVFVAVGEDGVIFRSIDGVQWVKISSPVKNRLEDVLYANGKFTAVGYYGTIVSSVDGDEWVKIPSPTGNILDGIAYGPKGYVVAGWNSILHSTDGVIWENQKVDGILFKIAFGNGAYVIASKLGIYTSADGYDWDRTFFMLEKDEYFGGESPASFGDVRYLDGKFIAVGSKYLTSETGKDWKEHTAAKVGSIAFGNNVFIGILNSSTTSTSADAFTWKTNSQPAIPAAAVTA